MEGHERQLQKSTLATQFKASQLSAALCPMSRTNGMHGINGGLKRTS